MKKVLVIGSNSFSGGDFIELLLEKEDYEIIGISRSPEKSSLFLPYKKRDLKHFKFYQINLNKDISKLERILDEFHPEYIVNFAAQGEVGSSWKYPHHWFQTNVVALTQLIHLLKDKKYIKKYVHISTPEVYGACKGTVDEKHHLNPSTPYAASKAAGDLSVFTFFKNFNFPLVMVRATNIYGACQQLYRIIPRAIIYIKKKKIIELHGGGEAVKSYIHIRDVSKGELLIMEKGKLGEIYHLSPDQSISIKDLVTLICKKMKVDFDKSTKIVQERLGQDAAYVIDSSKARNELKWKPEITFEEGLEEAINWVNNNFAEIEKEDLEYIHQE